MSCGICLGALEIILRTLIGQKYECYIVIKVIDVDELDEGNISAAAKKQDKELKAKLSCATLRLNQTKLNHVQQHFKARAIDPSVLFLNTLSPVHYIIAY